MERERFLFWPTVILMEGRPYVLKKLERKGVNDPCSMCDLRMRCVRDYDMHYLVELCKSDGRNDAWYFEEDWSIYPKEVEDFLNEDIRLLPPDEEIEREEMDKTLKHDL